MSMGIVDTIMVGHMANPALAISAAALGQVLYNTIAFGIAGILLGLDTYLAQSHGASRFDEANRWLLHGLFLAAGLALTLILVIMLIFGLMGMGALVIDFGYIRLTQQAYASHILPEESK